MQGISKNNVSGIAFVTNQELSLKERANLKTIGKPHTVEIYHLERISGILDTPENYGIRLEFLDIELSKEEQLAFFANRDEKIFSINEKLNHLMADYSSFKKSIEFSLENEGFHERTEKEILDAIDELTDKIWYDRHQLLKHRIDQGLTEVDSKIWKGALKSAKSVEGRYGIENLGPHGDFDWGMLNGKLSALRWLLGDDWDMLDT